MTRLFLALLLVLGTAACRTPAPVDEPLSATGIVTRLLRVRLAPPDTQAFEQLMQSCVDLARAKGLEDTHHWLCYREPPGRYWIVTFNETVDGFGWPFTIEGFVNQVAQHGDPAERDGILATLASLEIHTEWEWLTQQRMEWCTVEGISTKTHPKARIMARQVRRGQLAEFDNALTARTGFLARHNYPLPIEGFVTLDGDPDWQCQVVFPTDWPAFHARDSFGKFVEGLDETAQQEYAGHKAALLATMTRAEFCDGDHALELSFPGPQ